MEVGIKTPKREDLQQMPYSELKKVAKEYGIKGNMKAEKIIAALCSLKTDDLESFSTPAQKEINSSRKNKENKFNEDMMTPLATPRRGTYSIGSPTDKKDELKEDKMALQVAPKSETNSRESPSSVKTDDASFVSATFDTSAFDVSNITIGRGSERKLRRKVSFMSPVGLQSTPKNPSIKLRPKTPMAHRTPLGKRVSFSSPAREQKKQSSERSLRVTPHPKKSSERSLRLTPRPRNSSERSLHITPGPRKSFTGAQSDLTTDTPKKNAAAALPSVTELPEKQDLSPSVKHSQNGDKSILNTDASETIVKAPLPELSEKQHMTRSVKQSLKNANKSSSGKPVVSEGQAAAREPPVALAGSKVSSVSKSEASAKMKRAATPNFKKIHEKAFEKMESIDDYQKRKAHNSEKKINQRPNLKPKVTKGSKIPAFSGIPFIPSVPSNICKTLDFGLRTKKVDAPVETKKAKSVKENGQKTKTKFDLKTSLSRKLGYIPYKGPVKPLAESNILNASCLHNQKEPVNKVVTSNRLQTRSALKGVRTNKRFELQMKNRKLN